MLDQRIDIGKIVFTKKELIVPETVSPIGFGLSHIVPVKKQSVYVYNYR